MKLEISQKTEPEKYTKIWKLNSTLLKNEWVNNEIKKEIKRYLETNDTENTTTPSLWEKGKQP